MMTANSGQPETDQDVVFLPPGSQQYPAPRPDDAPTCCSACGAEMTFNPLNMVDGGIWTCNCAAGWAQQTRQLKSFAVMFLVFLIIAGLAV